MPSWKDDLTARERVAEVIRTVAEPVSINWVKNQADVHWETAESQLEAMADQGELHRVDRGESTEYVPDFTRVYVEEVRRIALEHSAEALRDEIVAIKEDIEEIQERFDVATTDELEKTLTAPDMGAEKTRERRRALRDWEELQDTLALVRRALDLQDDLDDVDPFVDIERGTGGATGTGESGTESESEHVGPV